MQVLPAANESVRLSCQNLKMTGDQPLGGPPSRAYVQTWQDAERNAADWMARWGFRGVRVTAGGPDAGIDVRAEGAVAQVKFQAADVGRPELQRLYGAAPVGAELLFFTGASYSARAIEYADERDIALFRYELDGSMKALNARARSVLPGTRGASPLPEPSRSTRSANSEETWTKTDNPEDVALPAGCQRFLWTVFALLALCFFVTGVAALITRGESTAPITACIAGGAIAAAFGAVRARSR